MTGFGKNKKVLLNGAPYIHIAQLPWCCAPACLYMVLVRRGIIPDAQEIIAEELGLIVPPEDVALFPNIIVGLSRGPYGGTNVQLSEYSINRYFAKRGIPLKERYYTLEEIESTKKFTIEFIVENLEAGNDLMVCFNYQILYGGKTNAGHVSLIQAIEGKWVTLIDPDREEERKVKLSDLARAMRHHGRKRRGGFWVISEENREG